MDLGSMDPHFGPAGPCMDHLYGPSPCPPQKRGNEQYKQDANKQRPTIL